MGQETPEDCRRQDGHLRKKRLEKGSKRKLGQGVGEGSLGKLYPRVASSGFWVSQFRGSGILGKTDRRLWPGPRNREQDPRMPFLLSSLWARPKPVKAEFRASLEAGLGGQNSLILTGRRLGYPSAVQRHFQEESAEKASSLERNGPERREEGEGRRRKGEARPGKGLTDSQLGSGATRRWESRKRSTGRQAPREPSPWSLCLS